VVTAPERSWPRLLTALLTRLDLTADDTRWAMTEVMDDAHEPAQLAAFLVALRAKGETAAELGGMLDALMDRVIPLPVDGSVVTDVVGTGGDGAHTVNISTMAALVTAAAGARVVKHGGRSVSSKSGSADVLEALGIPLDLDPSQVARCVTEIGIGFTFAPNFHHGLRHAAPVRRALGVPTAINYLAPLTNPARPATALIGCSSLDLAPVLATVLAGRGTTALVVRGRDGLDEITTADATDLWTATGAGIRKTTFDTARFGLPRARPGDLAGGDASCNAKVVRSVAAGEPGPALDAVLANAAGALAARNGAAGTAGFEGAFAAGLDQARTAVSSGAASSLLDQWIALAGELAGPR
jgi:anthranilate phosphoribosyltransferase